MRVYSFKKSAIISLLTCFSFMGFSQSTVTSGNWTDPTVWSGGAVPAAGGTVDVNNPLTITTNLSPSGTWTFNSNTTDVTDVPVGGTAYTFNPNGGTTTIAAGVTVTFEGGTAGSPNQFNDGTIDIYGTLILGYTDLNNNNSLKINVKLGGTLIINGDLVNKNNSGTFVIDGSLIVKGDFDNQTGSVTVGGTGTIDTTGSLTTTGGSTIFGTTNDCKAGPCSGSTLACTFLNYLSPGSATVCSGGSVVLTSNPVIPSGATAPTSPSYQWKSSTDNVTFSNVGTNSATYSASALTQTTYIKLSITSGACTSTSATTKLTVLPTGGWLGTTSNWGTASNWCSNSVPTSTTDVVITKGTGITNMPLIGGGTAALCRNLTISNTFPVSSITLAAAANASLSIYGSFTNNGTFTDNTTSAAAGVKLVGSTAQTIAGTTANVFNNLTIANTSGATPAINVTTNNVTVTSNLTMTSGLVNLNGFTITLGASAGTGVLAYTTGTRFYGGNIERWFPTTAITIPADASLFPIGTSADYRPVYFGSTGLSAAGGTIKVRHTASVGATAVSPTFADNGGTVAIRSNSFWTVTTANGISSTGTPISMRTEATGAGTVASVGDLRQTLVNTISPGSDGAHAGTTSNPQVNRTGLSVANITNNFYWGSTNASATTLPVELIDFRAIAFQKSVELKWATATELNFDHFNLLRSSDGRKFDIIATVKGNGTTSVRHDYSYIDEFPLTGTSYYRLQSVDYDGKTESFKVVSVKLETEKDALLYPIPVTDLNLNFQLNFVPLSDIFVTVTSVTGIELLRSVVNTREANLNLNLEPGVYIVKMSSMDFNKVSRIVIR